MGIPLAVVVAELGAVVLQLPPHGSGTAIATPMVADGRLTAGTNPTRS